MRYLLNEKQAQWLLDNLKDFFEIGRPPGDQQSFKCLLDFSNPTDYRACEVSAVSPDLPEFTWSPEPPTEPGWYWRKREDFIEAAYVVKEEIEEGLVVYFAGNQYYSCLKGAPTDGSWLWMPMQVPK